MIKTIDNNNYSIEYTKDRKKWIIEVNHHKRKHSCGCRYHFNTTKVSTISTISAYKNTYYITHKDVKDNTIIDLLLCDYEDRYSANEIIALEIVRGLVNEKYKL